MGNQRSVCSDEEQDLWWSKPIEKKSPQNQLDDFEAEFAIKREKRRQILAEKRKEMEDLRKEVVKLKKENEDLRKAKTGGVNTTETVELQRENEILRKRVQQLENDLCSFEDISTKNRNLRVTITEIQSELQRLNSEIIDFDQEREDYKNHVTALKDVISVSKQMLSIREGQLNELRQKIDEIEATVASKESALLSQNLKAEYEKQLENIKNLKRYYVERQKADEKEKEQLRELLEDYKKLVSDEEKKNRDLEENIARLEEENSNKYDEIKSLESNLGLTKAECRQHEAEMAVINQLFSRILLGFNNSQDMDIDKLIKTLEENHDVLQNIVNSEESSSISSALPKVFLDLINEVNHCKENQVERLETIMEEPESQTSSLHQFNSPAKIVENLPKVWRVLIELLSHQSTPVNNLYVDDKKNENPCYKLVQTPKGPSLVLSVSQTFIRLKDLILEKKSLEKETGHLKQLNTHLENRLQDQEKRLEMVSGELSKTWHVVGKLQKQHQLLHTQEKILRYELAQKRKLLTNLKEELEYSREKWQQAREKNSNTELQWRQLRTEFASRKIVISDNSVESGYSDERECSSSDDEPGYETDVSESTKDNSNPIVEVIQNQIDEIERGTDLCNETKTESEEGAIRVDLGEDEGKTDEEESIKSDIKTEEETEESCSSAEPTRTLEEILRARDERLTRLEGQASSLVQQVTNTTHRSIAICNKLEDLHEIYGDNNNGNDDDREDT